MKKYYYIEKDGRVFLIEKNKMLTLPTAEDKFDFKVEVKDKVLSSGDSVVYYCVPELERIPNDWLLKDSIIQLDNIDKIVKIATVKTYMKPVVLGIILKDDKVLMVKSKLGLTRGFWNMPGGFIRYGESPEEALLRELKEEIGVEIATKKLFGVYTHIFDDGEERQMYMIAFVYLCEPKEENFSINEEEIESIAYLSIDDAVAQTKNEFVKLALSDLKRKL